jgi:hypothetical protein
VLVNSRSSCGSGFRRWNAAAFGAVTTRTTGRTAAPGQSRGLEPCIRLSFFHLI